MTADDRRRGDPAGYIVRRFISQFDRLETIGQEREFVFR
jgi:hypothetical protein